MTELIAVVTGKHLEQLLDAFIDVPYVRTLRVWVDPLDGGVKFKFDHGSWSPPFGDLEITE
jgi:hypothetical protein